MISKDERQLNSVISKLFKANATSSSTIDRQCDPLPDVRNIETLVWSDRGIRYVAEKYEALAARLWIAYAKLQQYTASVIAATLTAGWQITSYVDSSVNATSFVI